MNVVQDSLRTQLALESRRLLSRIKLGMKQDAVELVLSELRVLKQRQEALCVRPAGVLKSPDIDLVRVEVEAVCHTCQHRHKISVTPDYFGRACFDWEVKHRGHDFEFLSTKRHIPAQFDDRQYEALGKAPWWMNYKENADIKIAYAADAAFTITLASLATDTNLLAGRESTSVSNTTNKYLDHDISGLITTGTSPTADKEIRLYYVRPIEDTPTWPDVFDGTDSNETIANSYIRDKLVLGWATSNSSSSSVGYPIVSALTLAQAWGLVPDDFEVFVVHNTGVNLHATGGNHQISYRGIYATAT